MDGSYLKFLPISQKLKLLEKDKKNQDNNILIESKKNKLNLQQLFYISRYQHIYRISLNNNDQKDHNINNKSQIQVINNNTSLNIQLIKSGIPLPFEIVSQVLNPLLFINNNKEINNLEDYLYYFIEKISQKTSIFYTFFNKKLHIYFRILESGNLIQYPIMDHQKKQKMICHYKINKKPILFDPKDTIKQLFTITEEIDQIFGNFFTLLKDLGNNNPQLLSLYTIIHKAINNYNCMKIENSFVSNMTGEIIEDRIKQNTKDHQSKIRRTNSMKDKTKPFQVPCVVSGCSLIRNKNDSKTPILVFYFYKNVQEMKYKKKGLENFDFSIRLCEDHGYLLSSIWYLFNINKIWGFEVFNTLLLFKNSNIYPSIYDIYNNYMLRSKHLLNEKKKIKLCIYYISEWIKKNQIN